MSKTINAAQLNDLLRNAQITVAFTKTDGSERLMRCTLQDRFLPELNAPAAPEVKEKASHLFVVWDLDEANWRSFRVSSVTSVSIAGLHFSPAKSMLLG